MNAPSTEGLRTAEIEKRAERYRDSLAGVIRSNCDECGFCSDDTDGKCHCDYVVQEIINRIVLIDVEEADLDRAALSGRLREWQPIETAPRDQFIFVYCPEDDTRWLAKFQDGSWHGVDDSGLTRTGMGPDDVTGWAVTHWQPLPPAPDAARAALAGVTAPTARSYDEHILEELLVTAYKRGFQWGAENASDPEAAEYVGKAARDYADYTMNGPTVGTGSSAGITAPSEVE